MTFNRFYEYLNKQISELVKKEKKKEGWKGKNIEGMKTNERQKERNK